MEYPIRSRADDVNEGYGSPLVQERLHKYHKECKDKFKIETKDDCFSEQGQLVVSKSNYWSGTPRSELEDMSWKEGLGLLPSSSDNAIQVPLPSISRTFT